MVGPKKTGLQTTNQVFDVSHETKVLAMPTLIDQIATLKMKLRRVSCQRDYWRRRTTNADYERQRKSSWRKSSPTGYQAELRRNMLRNRKRLGVPHFCPWCTKEHAKQGQFCSGKCRIKHYRQHGKLNRSESRKKFRGGGMT